MPSKGNGLTVAFLAWDTTNSVPKTGDAANFTLRWIKDGVSAVPTNAPASEVDSTNAPGIYKITLTNTEMNCDFGMLCGKSSSSGITLQPVPIATDHGVLPNVAVGSAGAVLCDGTGTAQIKNAGGLVDLVNSPNATAIAAIQLGLSTLTSAQAKAQMVAALNSDTYTVPGQGTPGDTVALTYMIGLLYKAIFHKITQDANFLKLFAADGSTVDQKQSVSSSGGTVTKGAWVSGP